MTIPPHGGELVDRQLTADQARELAAKADGIPRLTLNNREASDLRMIAAGAFSPLKGFMGRADYESTVRSAHLANGLAWTIPITLSAARPQADPLKTGQEIALFDREGNLLGSLVLEEKFAYDRRTEAKEVFRTEDTAHPGVANLFSQDEVLLGGEIRGLRSQPLWDHAELERSPAQTRKSFEQRGWKTVVGFQTRNPIHRAHEYIMKCALELVDGLMVHPLVGETKAGDVDADVRIRCYQALLKDYYPQGRTLLSLFPAFMRYAGPKEAIFHALIRKNYGCTHFIVGRDHAGVGNYYGTYDAQLIFREFKPEELGIQPMFFEHSFWCQKCGGMASTKTCPHSPDWHVTLSGTKVREMLAAGQRPPAEFSRPEVADILIEAARTTR
ncbi:MAG: sulfate adenylyltransferase [Chloroflexi bacterium]|nr:sulfate adenylyltransferase [Chloroflexota bacterium]